mgnify:CR=1 FL=1
MQDSWISSGLYDLVTTYQKKDFAMGILSHIVCRRVINYETENMRRLYAKFLNEHVTLCVLVISNVKKNH